MPYQHVPALKSTDIGSSFICICITIYNPFMCSAVCISESALNAHDELSNDLYTDCENCLLQRCVDTLLVWAVCCFIFLLYHKFEMNKKASIR